MTNQPQQPLFLLKTSDGMKVVKSSRAGHLQFYTEVILPQVDYGINWAGEDKIQLADWQQLMAFFEAGYKKTRGEQQATIFYSESLKRFAFIIYPQRCVGMSVQEVRDHPKHKEICSSINPSFQEFGSVHHHCATSAFQSSIDSHNESGGNSDYGWAGRGGLHVTVGKIGSQEYDLHGRVVFRGAQSSTIFSQWFDVPGLEEQLAEIKQILPTMRKWKGLFTLPDKLPSDEEVKEKLVRAALSTPPTEDIKFPKEWMDCLIESQSYPSHFASGVGFGYRDHGNGHSHGRRKKSKKGGTKTYAYGGSEYTPEYIEDRALTLADEVMSEAEAVKNVSAYRAIALLKHYANLKGFTVNSSVTSNIAAAAPVDQADKTFLEKATNLINRAPISYGTVIDCIMELMQADFQDRRDLDYLT